MCTRVFWNSNKLAKFSGRTMDWPESTRPLIIGFGAGRERNGGALPDQVVVADNPLRWTSKYASLITSVYGIGTVDGFNEHGLGVHALYLSTTEVGTRDSALPGLHTALWAQYLLDQAATVDEALSLMDGLQLVMVSAEGYDATLHLAIEDAGGDSAILELAAGKVVVHHGAQYTLMTNDPTYDEQLALLAAQDFSHPSMSTPLPGNVNAVDRFQRAAYYSALLPEPADDRQAVAGLMAVMRNASVPFGAPYGDFGVYNTEYRTVSDLTNRVYYFELTTSPSLIWVEFDKLTFGRTPLVVDPYDTSLVGNVSDRFTGQAIGF
jgi:penicillin V acylase-like amidase (Ntn superfamily)